MAESFSITLSVSQDSDEVLLLEQEDWDSNVGKYTKIDLIDQISSVLFDTEAIDPRCEVEDGTFVTGVFVYPYDEDLVYNIGVTWGELGEAIISEIEIVEAVNFSVDDEQSLTYPVKNILDYEWYDGMWDKEGNVTTEPGVTIEGNTVGISDRIYGSLKVTYTTIQHAYELQVTARDDVVENFYSSVVWTQWDGGCEMLEIDAPYGAEDDYFNDVTCSTRTQGIVNGGDEEAALPTAEPDTEEISIDYCSQEPLI